MRRIINKRPSPTNNSVRPRQSKNTDKRTEQNPRRTINRLGAYTHTKKTSLKPDVQPTSLLQEAFTCLCRCKRYPNESWFVTRFWLSKAKLFIVFEISKICRVSTMSHLRYHSFRVKHFVFNFIYLRLSRNTLCEKSYMPPHNI